MRFFKYLALLFLISFQVHATIYVPSGGSATGQEFEDGLSACQATVPSFPDVYYKDHSDTEGGCYSEKNGYLVPLSKKPDPICPKKNQLYVAWLPKGTTSIPLRMCIDGCTYEGSGRLTEFPNSVNTILFATGDNKNCSTYVCFTR